MLGGGVLIFDADRALTFGTLGTILLSVTRVRFNPNPNDGTFLVTRFLYSATVVV